MTIYGAIEAGGTKFVCAVGTGPGDLRDVTTVPTRGPDETLAEVLARLKASVATHGPLAAVGVASFGPVDLDPASPLWGHITDTPKPGWSKTDLAGPLREALGVPVGFDTDVNGAALGEARWGAGRGLDSLVYVTVGTGIGGGGVIHGRPLHGLVHPEMGHMVLPRRADDDFPGSCPFHGACVEGLASGPAIAQRWERPASELDPEHPAWDLEAHYLGLFAANLTLTLSPRRIVFGGGVMHVPGLLEKTRRQCLRQLAGYVRSDALWDGARGYLVLPELDDRAGVLGALELARRAGLEDSGQVEGGAS